MWIQNEARIVKARRQCFAHQWDKGNAKKFSRKHIRKIQPNTRFKEKYRKSIRQYMKIYTRYTIYIQDIQDIQNTRRRRPGPARPRGAVPGPARICSVRPSGSSGATDSWTRWVVPLRLRSCRLQLKGVVCLICLCFLLTLSKFICFNLIYM